jgi:aryl-alcohol dehydrogenase-like predicted oxidoreductase
MARDWLSPKNPGMKADAVLGTMNFGKRTPEDESVRIMTRALERGIDWFDTANAYGDSELIIGRFLHDHPKAARISTKCGIGPKQGVKEGLSAAVVRAALEASLQRLQVDHIEVYYLHAPDRDTPIQETIGVLEEARAAGKIGAWGVSNFASWRIAEINRVCGELPRPRVSQVIYNLLIRQLDLEYFDYAKQHAGLHTTVYNPLAGGLLAGKDSADSQRFASNSQYQKRYLTSRMRELSDAYAALAKDAGLDRVLMAYAWLANHPNVDSVLLGPATVAQLDVGIAGCDHPLDPELGKKIDELYRDFAGTDATYAR